MHVVHCKPSHGTTVMLTGVTYCSTTSKEEREKLKLVKLEHICRNIPWVVN